MSKCKLESVTNFTLEGRFLGFAAKEGYKLKYLRLATATKEYTIKLDKELRSTLWRSLTPGEWVQVSGYRKHSDQYGDQPKLKAYQVTVAPPSPNTCPGTLIPLVLEEPEVEKEAPKAKILVCQKSDCCQRGGRAITQALENALRDRQLTDQVVIKGTGCMKRCKAGPNIIMPDKTRYSRIDPASIPELVDKHLGKSGGVNE